MRHSIFHRFKFWPPSVLVKFSWGKKIFNSDSNRTPIFSPVLENFAFKYKICCWNLKKNRLRIFLVICIINYCDGNNLIKNNWCRRFSCQSKAKRREKYEGRNPVDLAPYIHTPIFLCQHGSRIFKNNAKNSDYNHGEHGNPQFLFIVFYILLVYYSYQETM